MQKIICFTVILLGYGCGDCMQEAKGIIIDEYSDIPLKEVKIGKIYKTERSSWEFLSDSAGSFDVGFISGGLFKCPDFELYFVKDGYQKLILKSPIPDTVVLKPNNSE